MAQVTSSQKIMCSWGIVGLTAVLGVVGLSVYAHTSKDSNPLTTAEAIHQAEVTCEIPSLPGARCPTLQGKSLTASMGW
jgi:hypothetical protein